VRAGKWLAADNQEETMRLTATTFVTIDGVMQGPGAPQEDPRDGFELGGWLPPYFNDETAQYMNDVFDKADAFVLGRFTYEEMAAYWATVTDPANRVGVALNNLPKHVVTSTLTDLSWKNSVLLTGDVAKQVAELKASPGRELQIHGSGVLLRSLMGHDLIDAYRLIAFPVVLGRGQRLFADGAPPAAFRLTDTRTTSRGVGMYTYEAAGEPAFGSVE
jgi:dihydrofolate reductase